jgi:hypothetical protein
MGLALEVGILADLRENDEEGLETRKEGRKPQMGAIWDRVVLVRVLNARLPEVDCNGSCASLLLSPTSASTVPLEIPQDPTVCAKPC